MFSIQALLPVLIATHILFGGLVLVLFKKDKSAKYWLSGCLILALGLTLILFRGILPDWLTYALANCLTLLSCFLFFISIQTLDDQKSNVLPWSLAIVACHGLAVDIIFASSWKPHLAIYISTVWCMVNLYFFFEILKSNRQYQNRYVSFMAYLFLGFSIVWGFHIFLSWTYGLNLVMDDKFANWLSMLLSTLLTVIRQLDYFAIRFSRMSEEKTQIERLLHERQKLISSLLKANKTATAGALSASIAHELNQPLCASSINLFTLKKYLSKRAIDDAELDQVIQQLEADNKRAATIIGSLKSLFTEGLTTRQEVIFDKLIYQVLEIAKPEISAQSIHIELDIEHSIVIRVNPNDIAQVILNLVSNSIQALSKKESLDRTIYIRAIKLGPILCLSISDNGPGIPDSRRSQLFELLSTTKEAGMGLGLWLCKHIVTQYGGKIYHDNSSSSGAKFIIELPCET